MKTIGNILWFIFGGFLSGLSWLLAGLFYCITVVGIPLGRQCFKFASLSLIRERLWKNNFEFAFQGK